MSKRKVPVLISKEKDLFVVQAMGLELASQGATKKEALDNFKEALDLLLEE